MGTQVFLGMPPPNIEQWIRDHHGPVVKETTVVKYTAASGLSDWEEDIVGELASGAIPSTTKVEEVQIGSHVMSIGNSAFYRCNNLMSVTIPDRVTSIGNSAFYQCTSLTSITIPSNVINIGSQAFSYCSGLSAVEFNGNAPTVGTIAFLNVATGCKALVSSTATGFPAAGETWNGLIVEVKQ